MGSFALDHRLAALVLAAGTIALGVLLVVALVMRSAGRGPRGQHAPSAGRRPNAHMGATAEWSPVVEVMTAPPPPPVDPYVRLAEARENKARTAILDREADRELELALDGVLRVEQRPYADALSAMQATVTERLYRLDHLEIPTREIDRSAFTGAGIQL